MGTTESNGALTKEEVSTAENRKKLWRVSASKGRSLIVSFLCVKVGLTVGLGAKDGGGQKGGGGSTLFLSKSQVKF